MRARRGKNSILKRCEEVKNKKNKKRHTKPAIERMHYGFVHVFFFSIFSGCRMQVTALVPQ